MKKALSVTVLLLLFFWGVWLHFYQLTSWPEEERMIQVHIEGSVKQPGVYTLPQSARLAELLEEAGGLSDDADAPRINLAKRLMDGEKVLIHPKPVEGEGTTFSSLQSYLPLEKEMWEAIPGIGPATAQKIIEYLQEHPAAAIEDLIHVRGIGPSKLAVIKEYFEE